VRTLGGKRITDGFDPTPLLVACDFGCGNIAKSPPVFFHVEATPSFD
jgi:hypothetical protein